jgi:acetyl esterase/lipase
MRWRGAGGRGSRRERGQRDRSGESRATTSYNEAFDLRSLPCLRNWHCWRPNAIVEAVARTYPDANMAKGTTRRSALYPGHLSDPADDDNLGLNPNVRVTSKTPPTFLLQAEDDPVDPVSNSLVYYFALKKAGVPVEMHLYAQGGHAFGVRPTNLPIARWPQLVESWLKTIKMVSP